MSEDGEQRPEIISEFSVDSNEVGERLLTEGRTTEPQSARGRSVKGHLSQRAQSRRGQNLGERATDDCRAEALAYMPIPRINDVAQGFIPASECGIRPEDRVPELQNLRVPEDRVSEDGEQRPKIISHRGRRAAEKKIIHRKGAKHAKKIVKIKTFAFLAS